jgi:hypothetical protein
LRDKEETRLGFLEHTTQILEKRIFGLFQIIQLVGQKIGLQQKHGDKMGKGA